MRGWVMTDHVIIPSPFGALALTPAQVREASATARDLVVALDIASDPTPTPSTGERWLTVSQTSDLMNLPHSFLYEGLNSGGIPGRKFGRFWRIPESYTQERKSLMSKSNGANP